jgi:hypothetical protein
MIKTAMHEHIRENLPYIAAHYSAGTKREISRHEIIIEKLRLKILEKKYQAVDNNQFENYAFCNTIRSVHVHSL